MLYDHSKMSRPASPTQMLLYLSASFPLIRQLVPSHTMPSSLRPVAISSIGLVSVLAPLPYRFSISSPYFCLPSSRITEIEEAFCTQTQLQTHLLLNPTNTLMRMNQRNTRPIPLLQRNQIILHQKLVCFQHGLS